MRWGARALVSAGAVMLLLLALACAGLVNPGLHQAGPFAQLAQAEGGAAAGPREGTAAGHGEGAAEPGAVDMADPVGAEDLSAAGVAAGPDEGAAGGHADGQLEPIADAPLSGPFGLWPEGSDPHSNMAVELFARVANVPAFDSGLAPALEAEALTLADVQGTWAAHSAAVSAALCPLDLAQLHAQVESALLARGWRPTHAGSDAGHSGPASYAKAEGRLRWLLVTLTAYEGESLAVFVAGERP